MVDSLTVGFLEVLGLGLLVACILFIVFSILRPKIPDVYDHRALLNTWKSHNNFNGARVPVVSPRPAPGFLGWLKPVFSVTEDEVVRKLGLDAAMFLRYLRTCLYMVCILAFFGAAICMPAYGTGSIKSDPTIPEVNKIEGLRVISLANVPAGDGRLWATVIMEFITAAVVIYFMMLDYRKFSELRREYRVTENPVNYSIVVFDIPEDCRSETAIRDRFELMVPGQVAEVVLVRQCAAASKLQKKLDTAVTKRELAEYLKANKGVSPEFRPGFCGCCMCHKPKVDSLDYWTDEQARLQTEISGLGETATLTPAAIVIFSNKRAAALLAQANIATSATAWTIVRAGEPDGTHWPAFGISSIDAEVRILLVCVFMVLFTLLWTIPATFIASLFSLKELTSLGAFSWLDFILDWNPALLGLIEGALPPIIMSVLIGLIPALFRFIVGKERIATRAVIERKTRDYFFGFTMYGSFLVIVLGSSIIKDLDAILDQPSKIIQGLAKGVPGAGVFFATFILLQTLIPLPMQLSGIVRVILRWIFLKLAKTERQIRKARSGGSLFQYFKFSGQAMLIMFLAIMYSSMSPLVTVCAIGYFGFANVVFRYMLYFTMYQPWDGGGELYRGAYWGTMIALILKQIVVIAVLGLKEGAAPAIVCVIPLLLTILVSMSVDKRYSAIAQHGSIYDMFEDSSKLEEIPRQYQSVYEPPAGLRTYYANLNGVEEITDVYSEVQCDEDNLDGLQSEHHDDNVGYVPDRAADRSEV